MRSLLRGLRWGVGGWGVGGGGVRKVKSKAKKDRTFGQFTRFLTHDTEEIMVTTMDISMAHDH